MDRRSFLESSVAAGVVGEVACVEEQGSGPRSDAVLTGFPGRTDAQPLGANMGSIHAVRWLDEGQFEAVADPRWRGRAAAVDSAPGD